MRQRRSHPEILLDVSNGSACSGAFQYRHECRVHRGAVMNGSAGAGCRLCPADGARTGRQAEVGPTERAVTIHHVDIEELAEPGAFLHIQGGPLQLC